MKKILLLCTGNSCRSQMAHGILNSKQARGELKDWEIYSAGIQTDGGNPYAQQVMEELGVNIRGYTSNHVEEYKQEQFNLMLSFCDHAKANCPWFPSEAKLIHHPFEDPAGARGTDAEKLKVYRRVRDEIAAYLESFVKEEMEAISPSA